MGHFIRPCTAIRTVCIVSVILTIVTGVLSAQTPSANGDELITLNGDGDYQYTIAFSHDGKKVITLSSHADAKIWDAYTGDSILTFRSDWMPYYEAAFSPDGKYLVLSRIDTVVQVLDAGSGEVIRALDGHTGSAMSVRFSNDGEHIVTSGVDSTVRIWKTSTGELIRTMAGHRGMVYQARFTPDGKRVISSSRDSTVRIWDVETGQQIKEFRPFPNSFPIPMDVSPDGSLIAIGSAEINSAIPGLVYIISSETGELVRELPGNKHGVAALSFSSSGTMLAMSGGVGPARVWNMGTGDLLFEHPGTEVMFDKVVFSPVEDRLALTGSTSPIAYIWILPEPSSVTHPDYATAGERLVCFPNPAADVVDVSYVKTTPGRLRITLHNSMGAIVANQDDDRREVGRMSYRFDIGSLPSGNYLCSVWTEKGASSIPMRIVR